ncbi:MAG: hypothetical protein ACRD6W_00695 [Nitrososphaerales archaeon]
MSGADMHQRVQALVRGAYATAKKDLDEILDSFGKNEWQERKGFERALEKVCWEREFWYALLDHGNGSTLTLYFDKPDVIEAKIIAEYPAAAVYVVMES